MLCKSEDASFPASLAQQDCFPMIHPKQNPRFFLRVQGHKELGVIA